MAHPDEAGLDPWTEPDTSRRHAVLASAIAALLAMIIHGFRVTSAPDLLGDEGLYFLVAHNLASGVGLVDDVGTFFWHPPGYPILASLWIHLTGSLQGDFTTALLGSRQMNVIFSAATAALLVLFGRRLLNLRAGLLMAAIFIGDLFVQRINRRAMLETVVLLLILIALYLFYSRRATVSKARVLGTGLAFGVAILTKEVAVVGIIALGTYVIGFQRQLLPRFAGVVAVAASMYGAYVAWALLTAPERFLAFKIGAFSRVFALGRGVVPREARLDYGANPGILERLGPALISYGPTYAMLGIGSIVTLVLFLRYRDRRGAQLVLCWSGVSYVAIGFGAFVGFGDQFFYYVLVPAIVAISYLLSTAWDSLDITVVRLPSMRRRLGAVTLSLALLATYDLGAWATRYAGNRDDSYTRLTSYVRKHVPLGSTILVGGDVSNFLLRPDYDIAFFRDRANVRSEAVRYFILSTKEAQQRYNRMTPDFYDWIRSNTEPLIEFEGDTYWTLGLYEWVDQASGEPHRGL